jgi:hypothetical protein
MSLQHVLALSLGTIKGTEHIALDSKAKATPRLASQTPGMAFMRHHLLRYDTTFK